MLRTDRVGRREREGEARDTRWSRKGVRKTLVDEEGGIRTRGTSGPGSGDVRTLRTRSLIGDDLWRHSIFSLLVERESPK